MLYNLEGSARLWSGAPTSVQLFFSLISQKLCIKPETCTFVYEKAKFWANLHQVSKEYLR